MKQLLDQVSFSAIGIHVMAGLTKGDVYAPLPVIST